MDMNFPHDSVHQASSVPLTLRALDMDILRALACTPVVWRADHSPMVNDAGDPVQMLAAWLSGLVRADRVVRGSFNPHFADALNRFTPSEQHGQNDVYHCASVNRKADWLHPGHAQSCSNQAF
ncbi:hypothetical protein [Blastomonas sp. UPD001]|jgi:hypothetical protein|uniref:hypothetical protein n=1 Tax=unclassified Blastomonas TaxID=2626550 RepID=UPI000E346221|nr:hypothetical protein [Blastomonas sp. UPD001]